MPASYHFRFSEEHLITSVLRQRQQLAWGSAFKVLTWVLRAIFAIAALGAAYAGIYVLAVLLGVICAVQFAGWPIDAWLMRRNLRKSPSKNGEFHLVLSEAGMQVTGPHGAAQLAWASFTRARRFSDGLMLFQEPGVFNWMPDAAASDPADIIVARELAKTGIADYRNVS